MSSVIVLGAGMAGVATALELQKLGWAVALVDQGPPGTETSYGNAGIIQAEAVEPHAVPWGLGKLLAMVLGFSNELHYSWRGVLQQGRPLVHYAKYSMPARHHDVSAHYAQLARRATRDHAEFIHDAQAEHLVRRDGFRMMHRTQQGFDRLLELAHRVHTRYGVPVKLLTANELLAAEPPLHEGGAGGVHWLDSWTVSDPGSLVDAYATLFLQRGGTFAHADATTVRATSNRGWRLRSSLGVLEAEHIVVSLGPWSAHFFQRFGVRFPMFYKRGYHRHYAGPQLNLPLMDVGGAYVMAPMRRGLRITTGADIAAWGAPPAPVQLRRAERYARRLVNLGAPVESQPWSGLRPCMPDMLPVIGRVPGFSNLWAHFGHGHQGFTQGPTTAMLLAQLMCGETPALNAQPFHPERFL